MAELRHSASMGNRSNAVASPVKRDATDDSKPFFSSSSAADGPADDDSDDGERRRPSARARDHKDLFFHRSSSFLSSIRSLLDDPRGFWISHSRILLASAGFLIFLWIVFLPSVWSRWSSPYLCYKDGITLHCPRVRNFLGNLRLLISWVVFICWMDWWIDRWRRRRRSGKTLTPPLPRGSLAPSAGRMGYQASSLDFAAISEFFDEKIY